MKESKTRHVKYKKVKYNKIISYYEVTIIVLLPSMNYRAT